MSKVNGEIAEVISDLYANGRKYREIVKTISDNFGIDVSEDTVRFHAVRKDKPKYSTVEKLQQEGISKKLILSDLHIPYHLEDVLDIVDEHADEIDEIIFNGDIIDCEEISVYTTVGAHSLMYEMIAAHGVLKKIDAMTPGVKKTLILGNHEKRWEKYLGKKNTSFNGLHSTNILREVVEGFTHHNFEAGTETKYVPLTNYRIVNDWYTQVHDVICCHPLTFSKIKGRVATMAVDYFIQDGHDFNAIIVGHTHKQAVVKQYDKISIEQGCLCQPMKYSKQGKLSFTPQDCGYVLATFVDGHFDMNQSRLYMI